VTKARQRFEGGGHTLVIGLGEVAGVVTGTAEAVRETDAAFPVPPVLTEPQPAARSAVTASSRIHPEVFIVCSANATAGL
jgi:hypothetical protein